MKTKYHHNRDIPHWIGLLELIYKHKFCKTYKKLTTYFHNFYKIAYENGL